MSGDPELFARCPLPGCATPVATDGEPCTECRTTFGDMLTHNPGGAPLTAQAQADRDSATRAAYRDQHAIATPARAEVETRANQLCWLCENRRRCTRIAGRWECRDCQHIT